MSAHAVPEGASAPQGHVWTLATRIEETTEAERA